MPIWKQMENSRALLYRHGDNFTGQPPCYASAIVRLKSDSYGVVVIERANPFPVL
jgi:hypothetical protein